MQSNVDQTSLGALIKQLGLDLPNAQVDVLRDVCADGWRHSYLLHPHRFWRLCPLRYVGLTLALALLIVACARGGPGYCGGVTEYDYPPCPKADDAGSRGAQDSPSEAPSDDSTPDASPSNDDAPFPGGCNGIGCSGGGTGGAPGPGSGGKGVS